MEHGRKEKILLDTDIGNDIDDMLAIAYLLSHPRSELIGVTTVTAESVKRAEMVRALLLAANRNDVPVFPGAERPLLIEPHYNNCPQATALNRYPHSGTGLKGEYLSFMRNAIREHPGEITLLAIGPMTNVGLLLAMDPELATLLKRLVIMCGVFESTPYKSSLEWNAKLDPHAAAIVYNASPNLLSVGLNVTATLRMPVTKAKQHFANHPLLSVVSDIADSWMKDLPSITFHDPLCASLIFEKSLCKYKKGKVIPELKSDHVLGMTHFYEHPDGPHEITTEVNSQAFFDHFFSVFQ